METKLMGKRKNAYFISAIRFSLSLMKRTCFWQSIIFVILRISLELTKVYGLLAFGKIIDYCSGIEITISDALLVSIPFFVLLIAGVLSSILSSYFTFLSKEKLDFEYEKELIQDMNSLPMSVLDSSEGKNLIDEAKNAKEFVTSLPFTIVELLAMGYSFCVAITYMSSFSIVFTSIYIIFTIPGILTNAYWGRKVEHFRHEKAPDVRKFCYYRWILTDPWPAKDVRVYNLSEPLKARYDEEKDKYSKDNIKLDLTKLKYAFGAEMIMRIGEVVFTIYVINEAYRDYISIGDVAVLLGFASTLFYSFRGIFAKIILSKVAAEERFKYVTILKGMKVEVSPKGRHIDQFEELSFENVSFRYPYSEDDTLHNISFTVHRGELLSIIGANGAGKSTIIKLMIGLYKPSDGVIKINGYPIEEYRREDVHKIFSVLFQDYCKYSLNLRENVALSKIEQKDCDSSAIKALKKGFIWDDLVAKGCDLDSELTRQFDDKGIELSIGQWQRVALSRMWFKESEVMILDEPSASLDPEAEDFVFNSFLEMSRKSTGIMISHRISSAQLSTNIIVIEEGRIVEQGTHSELLANNSTYAKMYNLQKRKYVEEGIKDGKCV